MTKEQRWMDARCGRITASELSEIMSASGKIIDGCVSYIRAKRWEREHGYSIPVSSKTMDLGNENEPMIYKWVIQNGVSAPYGWVIYSKDESLKNIPFWSPADVPYFGASPDAFAIDEETVFEFKTLVGNESTYFFMDKYTPYVDKKARVLKEHGDQILGLFISNPKVKRVVLVKYVFQRDDVEKDLDSPLAPWRGLTFTFEREDYEGSIAAMKKRIELFNAMIDAPINPVEFKSGEWYVNNGELKKK